MGYAEAEGSLDNQILSGAKRTQPQPRHTNNPPLSGPGSGHVRHDVPSTIAHRHTSPFGPNETDTNDLSGVTITLTLEPGNNGTFDNLVVMPTPCKRILVSSIGPTQPQELPGLWLSLKPTGIQPIPPNIVYTPQGTERWIQLRSSDLGNTVFIEGMVIEFRKPVSRFYLSASSNTTGNFPITITFCVADDICKIDWRPQSNTQG
jgi:hypothetical protein